jgi:hypothetical protein
MEVERMSEIISRREKIETVEYVHRFTLREEPQRGWSFPCTEEGELLEMHPAATENYNSCVNGAYDVVDHGIVTRKHSCMKPAILRCDCGEEVALHGFTNTCDNCGIDYNLFGQQLCSREFWGEETGENPEDCV